MSANNTTLWTIGHSNRTFESFVGLLQAFGIRTLIDIRTFPGSRKYPHFNRESMAAALEKQGIKYLHVPELGGRRKPRVNSQNTAWKNDSFRGYADHMETDEFQRGLSIIESEGRENATAYMCSEAVWWKCHRALVSDLLKARGWTILHIMDENKSREHPYSSPARVQQGKLFYN